ncbi:MAG: hypothetical protein ABJE95_19970 [Byssovorax sp.]
MKLGVPALALAAACDPVLPSQPTEAIVLCGSTCISGTDPSNTVSKTTGGVATYAWGTDELFPPAADPYGTDHRLTWTASTPDQILIAFDTDFSIPLPDPSCPGCSEPYNWSFVSLPGTGGQVEKKYNFASFQNGGVGFTTGHLMRVDRGACRSFVNWGFLFEQVKQKLDTAVGCAMQCAIGIGSAPHQINRTMVDIQPHFTGVHDDVEHGILLTATYQAESQYGVSDEVTINPVYTFGVDPATGRLGIEVAQLGVVTFNDVMKAKVEAALSTRFVEALRAFADPQAFPAEKMLKPIFSDKQASLASQQAFCFGKATVLKNGEIEAFNLLHSRLTQNGHPEPEATDVANLALSALEPRNFSCEATFGEPNSQCVIRSTYKRLYALPTLGVEAVHADRGEAALVALYQIFGGGSPPWATCEVPIKPAYPDGAVPRDSGSAPEMNVAEDECFPCP